MSFWGHEEGRLLSITCIYMCVFLMNYVGCLQHCLVNALYNDKTVFWCHSKDSETEEGVAFV